MDLADFGGGGGRSFGNDGSNDTGVRLGQDRIPKDTGLPLLGLDSGRNRSHG